MNQQAANELGDAICAENWGLTHAPARMVARRNRPLVQAAIAATLEELPAACNENTASYITPVVQAKVHRQILAGILVVTFISSVFWSVIVGVVSALIVRWLLDGKEKGALVRRARGS